MVRFDEIILRPQVGAMKSDLVFQIQRDYPRIYLACHVDHVRARTSVHGISSRDSSLLAHLDASDAQTAGALAAHLGVAASTLSATLMRLERLGYLTRARSGVDKRFVAPKLTAKGREAVAATSVLDRARVAMALEALTPAERSAAVRGLALLAKGATAIVRKQKGQGS
jgi:DNA-binding MarR family transcriptional regulator